MRLIKRLLEVAFVILVLSFFMENKDLVMKINYYGLSQPIDVAFWELVTLCVSLGIIIAAIGDFITQLKWVGERRRLLKTDKEHSKVVDGLNQRIEDLQSEVSGITKALEEKTAELESARMERDALSSQLEKASTAIAAAATEEAGDSEPVEDAAKP
jgi:uncharacterized protein YlxW (UPF0749 family)